MSNIFDNTQRVRTNCKDGQDPEVLVIDCFDQLWGAYLDRLPAGTTYRLVRFLPQADITPGLRLIVIQGRSYTSALHGDVTNTMMFLKRARDKYGFKGKMVVASSLLSTADARDLSVVFGDQVMAMSKDRLFSQEEKELLAGILRHRTPREVLEELVESYANATNPGASDDFEAAGSVLEWLDCFAKIVRDGSPRDVYEHLVMLEPEHDSRCTCWDLDDPQERWWHEHHTLLNRAYLEIILAAPDELLYWLASELHADLASPDRYIDGDGPFGRFVRKDCGRLLQGFLRLDGPESGWVD